MARTPPQPLPDLPKTDEIIQVTQQAIKDHKELLDKIVDTIQVSNACFDNVLKPLVELENAQAGYPSVLVALKYCSTEQDLQTTAHKAKQLWDEYHSYDRKDMYHLVRAVKDRKEALDPESQKLLNKRIQRYEKLGFGILDEEQIQQIQKRNNEINELSRQIIVNIQKDQAGLSIPVDDLKDVPAQHRKSSQSPDGTEFYTFSEDCFMILRHVSNADIRKKMSEGYHLNRTSVAAPFREILVLRDENARELGFQNHAATKMSERFADSIEWVEDLLSTLEDALAPLIEAKLQEVKSKKQQVLLEKNQDTSHVDIESHEFAYYRELLDTDLQHTSGPIAEYYPLYPTFQAMLDLFASCFQLKFEPLPQDQLLSFVWHKSVIGWTAWDERTETHGEFIGYLFADLVSRPLKYKGFQSANLQPSYLRPDGSRIYPANVIMCAFSEGHPDTGTLLDYRRVSVMFHELGHSIHDLIARTKYAEFHGYNVALELCEGIGSMLQAFCWYPEIMRTMSHHYTRFDPKYADAWLKAHPGSNLPPETIPDDILLPESTRGGVTVGSLTNSLVESLFDIGVHNAPSKEALQTLDEMELYKNINQRIRKRSFPSPSYTYLDQTLLVAGYEAGVYSYLCSELIGADILKSKFAENPRSQEAWEEFRRCILQNGGSRDEVEMLTEYLGRSIDPKAIISVLR